MTTESIITLTPKAITKVQDILSKEQSETAMLRVLAMPSPGGSIQYMFAVEETSAENDQVFEFEKIKVLVDENSIDVFWTSGTAFLTRKNIFSTLGRFDKGLFAHMEEIDFSWKCYLAGFRCSANPESIVFHHGGKTLGYDSPYKTYLNHRNSMILLLTNYNLLTAITLFPIRVVLEIISSVNDLLKLKIFHFLAHYRALIALLNIPYLYKRRALNSKIRKVSDASISAIFKKSIVCKYFAGRIKTFDKLNLP